MNPRLYIVRARNGREYRTRRSIRFAIIDCDHNRAYPSNFICTLPQRVTLTADDESIFAKVFGEKRIEVAKKLLKTALQSEADLEIKTEIRQRLRMLDFKDVSRREI